MPAVPTTLPRKSAGERMPALGSETIDIAAGVRDYAVADRYVLPVDAEVIAIQPHAHNLARRMRATATRPDGQVLPLIAIDDWDFRWQDVYRYRSPIALPRGSTIAMQYTYDNSPANPRNPSSPPVRVVWGQNSTDEMGDLWVQLVPRQAQDLTMLSQDVRRKAVSDDLAAGRLMKPFDLVVEEERRAWYVIHRPGAEKEAPFAVFLEWLVGVGD